MSASDTEEDGGTATAKPSAVQHRTTTDTDASAGRDDRTPEEPGSGQQGGLGRPGQQPADSRETGELLPHETAGGNWSLTAVHQTPTARAQEWRVSVSDDSRLL